MRRLLPVAALAAVCLYLGDQRISGQQLAVDRVPIAHVVVESTNVAELREWDAFITNGSRSGDLRPRSVGADPLVPSRTVERFEQFHRGIRIWGADIVRESERGTSIAMFGELSPHVQLSTDPSLTISQAQSTLVASIGGDASLLDPPELVIARLDNGDHRLSYTAVVFGNGDAVRVFIDAETGAEIMRYSEIQRQQAAVGTGRGVLGDQKKLSVEGNAGAYIAVDRLRPPIIRVFDLGGDLLRFLDVDSGRRGLSTSDLARDGDNVWTDPAVVDAHAHVGMAYDYYFKRFGRAGIDGRNAPINILANAVSQQSAVLLSAANLNYAVNASWCAPCLGGQGRLWFGNGIPPGTSIGGVNTTYTAGALDTVAHELTHAVTTFTSGLIYLNESGALNEAFSDMMGKGAEFFYHPPGNGVGQADYVFSKDTDRAVVSGAPNGIRSLANPAAHGQPDHYSNLRRLPPTAAGDNGGVHVNSGIPNHAYYLAIEGGTNRTSGMTVQGVGGANREQIEKVFFRAFTTLLPSSATFSMARAATIQSARDLYGSGSPVERAVTQAWDAVGVTATSSIAFNTLSGTVASSGATSYLVTMPATGRYQAILNWNDPSIDLDLLLSVPSCTEYGCMLTQSNSPTRRPEAVCWQVRAGEQYRVWVDNWTNRSTSFTIQQSVSNAPSGDCSTPNGVRMTGGFSLENTKPEGVVKR